MGRTSFRDGGPGADHPVTIVMYHSVSEPTDTYSISPSSFRRQLEAIATRFRVIPLSTLPEDLTSERSRERRVVLTFDDGYVDFVDAAFPVLEALGLPSTLFVPTGCLGGHNAWDSGADDIPRRSILDRRALRRLHDTGLVEIGSHTVDHVRMSRIPPEQMLAQALESRHVLEDLLGGPVTSFSYPYGQLDDFSDASTRALAEAGYSVGVTTHWGTRNASADLLTLRRIWFRETDSDAVVKRKVEGWYDWMAIKERAGSALRRARRTR
jgi:peptidoglycan/xylan/chitin deacetylase (PgdA/CDA1 family)